LRRIANARANHEQRADKYADSQMIAGRFDAALTDGNWSFHNSRKFGRPVMPGQEESRAIERMRTLS
jgi:hypothetical protein